MKLAVAFVIAFTLSAAGQTSADLILINGNVRTLAKSKPRAEAIAVAKGRIVAIGGNAAIRRLAGPQTRVIDAHGRLVIPGFNDAHVHFAAIGNQFSYLDLRGVREPAEMLRRIAHYANVLPGGRWIIGGGLNIGRNRLPNQAEADAASGGHPMLLYFADPSSVFVNSAALARAGMEGTAGTLTGPALARVRRRVPSDHARDWPEIVETASTYAASLGVTSVQDVHSDDLIDVYRKVERSGKLKTRVYECIGLSDWKKLAASGPKRDAGPALVRNGCVKGVAHGDTDEVESLAKEISDADRAGLQVMIHAIGQSANANALTAFERANELNGHRDRRFRVEHAHDFQPSEMARFARSRTIASMQPHLFYRNGSSDDDYRAMLGAGIALAFGSDASITDFNPLLGIRAAVNSGRGSISVEDAVRAYTVGSAYAEFQEGVKGTLEVGRIADFIVLSADIFKIDASNVDRAKVLMTVVNGAVVFEGKH